MQAPALNHQVCMTQEEVALIASKEQYVDIAQVYDENIGSIDQRTPEYKSFFGQVLKEHGCVDVLDAACGTGVDSLLLMEQGFTVVSVDGSEAMLEHVRRAKREREHDPKYKDWMIGKANWQTLREDIDLFLPGALFDAVVCLANSFAHVLDARGDQRVQRACVRHFARCLRPGGLLVLDHRNYDAIVHNLPVPARNPYYNYKNPLNVKTTLYTLEEKAVLVAIDFIVNNTDPKTKQGNIRLCYYPHKLAQLTQMLDEAFPNHVQHRVYGDFKPLEDAPAQPGFYIHVVQKALEPVES